MRLGFAKRYNLNAGRVASRPFVPLALAIVALPLIGPIDRAAAQMELPGAVAPTPEGSTISPEARPKPKPKRVSPDAAPAVAAPAKVPLATSLGGQTLFLNGRKSQITFDARGKDLAVSKLVLFGQHGTNSRDECQVTPSATSIPTTDLGRPNGLVRIKLNLAACPITFDVLDGAVLAIGDPPVCEFSAPDCKTMADGLWGPQPASLGPDQIKGLEKARAQAEAAVRADYHVLVHLTKDRPTIMGYAREQAGFTSAREEICRDYSGEGRHNFCAARLTEARVAALKAKIEAEAAGRKQQKAKVTKPSR